MPGRHVCFTALDVEDPQSQVGLARQFGSGEAAPSSTFGVEGHGQVVTELGGRDLAGRPGQVDRLALTGGHGGVEDHCADARVALQVA